jgi:hypothetical protein
LRAARNVAGRTHDLARQIETSTNEAIASAPAVGLLADRVRPRIGRLGQVEEFAEQLSNPRAAGIAVALSSHKRNFA